MTGKKKKIVIVAILVILVFCIMHINLLIDNDQNFKGNIIGNPDYEDSLYISYPEFKEKFEKEITGYKYKITEDKKKREFLYHFEDNIMLRTGLKMDNKTLSFIIFKWPKDKNETGVIISRILYRVFNSNASDVAIKNHLLERKVIDGEMEISMEEHEMYYPNSPVRFEFEKKDGYIKLYINDKAMSY